MKDQLATRDEPASFEELASLTLRIDNRLRERERERSRESQYSLPRTPPRSLAPMLMVSQPLDAGTSTSVVDIKPEPIQGYHSRLSPEERERRLSSRACFYCSSQEHLVASCLRKRWSDPPVVSGVRVGGSHFTRKPRLVLTVTLESNQALHSLQALVDSGSEQNLVNTGLSTQLGIPLTRLEQAIPARALNNPIFAQISHITKPVTLVTSGNHRESVTFYVLPSADSPLTLGFPWLKLHNPHLDWEGQKVISWSLFCHSNCLTCARVPRPNEATSLSERSPDLTGIPTIYYDLREVLNKSKAQSLPPHRPYDCAIDLLPGAQPKIA